MSDTSPLRRPRTRTAELTDFLRGSKQQHAPSSPVDSPQTPTASEGSFLFPPTASSSKKSMFSSRIPFMGRSRKKSLSSDPTASTSTQDSRGVVTPRSFGNGHTVLMISQPSEPSPCPRVPASPPPLESSTHSKYAPHFPSEKTRGSQVSSVRSLSVRSGGSSGPSISHSSTSPRPSSPESVSSSILRNRSTTPRPSRTSFNVSVSPPEDNDQFVDLFTLPRLTPASPPPIPPSKSPLSNVDSKHDHVKQLDVPGKATSTPPGSPHAQTFSITSHTQDSSGYSNEKRTIKKRQLNLSAVRQIETALGTKMDIDSTESEREMGNSWAARKRSTLSNMPYKSTERSPSLLRSAMKNGTGSGPSAPPSIPLPSPPSSVTSSTSLPTSHSSTALSSRKPTGSIPHTLYDRRPRSNTGSSASMTPSVPPSGSPPTPPDSSLRKPRKKLPEILASEKPPSASSEDLRQTLAAQCARFDELAAYLLKMTENHVAEKMALEMKIDSLEKEAKKRDREIKGLRYLVMNGTGSGSTVGSGTTSTSSTRSLKSIVSDVGSTTVTRTPSCGSRRPEDDQALRVSLSKPGMEPLSAVEAAQLNSFRMDSKSTMSSSSLEVPVPPRSKAGLGLDFTSDATYMSGLDKRSSVSSFSSSAGSSTSSLSLPVLGTASTASSALSVIPESASVKPDPPRDPAVAAAILSAERHREKEERRISRVMRRLSSSSSSSSASASTAHSGTMKRGRPPSIAQVLEQSPSMEDVMEKLRPFGASTSPTP